MPDPTTKVNRSANLYGPDGRQVQRSVAPLVATAFIGSRPGGNHAVEHIDGDGANLRANNLRWVRRDAHLAPSDLRWRTIREFSNYEIREDGVIRRMTPDSRGRFGGQIMTPVSNPNTGHLGVGLRDAAGKLHRKTVHSLIARAFLGEPPTPYHEVAHNDGNPKNNALSNLRYATRKENSADRWLHGTMLCGERGPNVKLTALQVEEIREALKQKKHGIFTSLARQYNVSDSLIHAIYRGQTWTFKPKERVSSASS